MNIAETYSVTSPLNVSFSVLPFHLVLYFYLFVLLGTHCCVGFALVVGSEGYSLVAVHRLLSLRAWALGCMGSAVTARGLGSRSAWAQQSQLSGSRAQAQQLQRMGLVAPWLVGSSQTRDRTHVSSISKQILYH